MKRLDSRIDRLESVDANLACRTMSDLELAVRLDHAINQGGPLAAALLNLLAAATPQMGERQNA